MNPFLGLLISRKSLFSHKMRTALSLSGIAIGVAILMVMAALGAGAEKTLEEEIKKVGDNLLLIKPGKVTKRVGRSDIAGIVTTLKINDSDVITESSALVHSTAPSAERDLKIKYGDFTTSATIIGTTRSFFTIRNFEISNGRSFNPDEMRRSARVAILGSSVHESLLSDVNPVGEIIRIKGIPFEVIGVLKSKGFLLGGNEDSKIIIPLKTAMRRVFNQSWLNAIYIRIKSRPLMGDAEDEIREILRSEHGLNPELDSDDFSVLNQATVIRAQAQTSEDFSEMTMWIAAISLFVGGFGIIAVMLMTIKERTGEIGLRMAVGARPLDILLQFLAEACLLTLIGALAGLMFALSIVWGINYLTEMTSVVTLDSIYLSLGISAIFGLVFGVLPAWKASRLDPIIALHKNV